MLHKLLAHLKNKVGPLPVWAWASIAGGAGWYWLRMRGGGSSASSPALDSQLPPPVSVPATDSSGGSSAGDLSSGADSLAGAQQNADLGDLGLQHNIDAAKGQIQDLTDFLGAQTDSMPAGGAGKGDVSGEAVNPETGGRHAVDTPKVKAGGGKGKPTKLGAAFTRIRGRGGKKAGGKPGKPKSTGGPGTSRRPRPVTAARPNRGAPKHGGGSAGARPRNRPRPKPPKVRPRAKPKPKTVKARAKASRARTGPGHH